jgi:hypothetical protein
LANQKIPNFQIFFPNHLPHPNFNLRLSPSAAPSTHISSLGISLEGLAAQIDGKTEAVFDDGLSINVHKHILEQIVARGNGWLISPLDCGALQERKNRQSSTVFKNGYAKNKNSKNNFKNVVKLLVI